MIRDNCATLSGGQAGIGLTEDGFRYHVWVNPETFELVTDSRGKATLYKNPPEGVKYREPGYFDTRRLDPWAKANEKITATLLKDAEHQIRRARDKQAAEERKAAADHAERVRVDRIRDAAIDLLDALRECEPFCRGHQETPEKVARYQRVRAAIERATGAAQAQDEHTK